MSENNYHRNVLGYENVNKFINNLRLNESLTNSIINIYCIELF